MSSVFIFPYKADSQGAIALSEALDCYRINRQNSQFVGNPNRTVINWGWGNALPSEVMKCKILNKPEAVAACVNKLTSFAKFEAARVSTPEWTRDYEKAKNWFINGHRVYCRATAEGMDGAGITIAIYTLMNELPRDMAFYTKGLQIRDEYRINVVGDEVVCFQKKVPVTNFTGTRNDQVRTTGGGWGFEVVEEWEVPSSIDGEAIAAVKALGLDFGGVDVIYTAANLVKVLEVNSAPHLTPYSSQKYANAFKELIN